KPGSEPMVKFLAAAVWICAVTIGAVFYSFQTTSAKPAPDPKAAMLGGLDYVKTDILSIPVVKKSGISGYFLTRLVYTVDPAIFARLSIPAESLIVDEVYSYLYGSPDIDFSQPKDLDLAAFRNAIREAINKRVGEEMVYEVMV